jgi:hypothetical protein
VVGVVARLILRLFQYLGMRNVYVRRSLWVLAIVRWFLRRRQGTSQMMRLRKGESLVVTIEKNETRFS